VVGEAVLTQHFHTSAGTPVVVIGNASAAAPLRSAFAATPGIASVTPPVVRDGTAYLQGTLTSPPDSQAAYDTIDRVRSAVHAVPGADAKVGGITAINLDVARASAHDRNLIIPLILVVVFIVLALLLRALIGPLVLIGTVVLSFAAALGVSAFFFNHVFGFGGADTSFPLFVFVFLVALGIDYNIFLMTRVREEAIKRRARRDRRCDHFGRFRAGRDVRRPGHDSVHATDRDRIRGRPRDPARHHRRPVRAGDRAQPGPRALDVVAEQAVPQAGPGPGGTRRGARRRADQGLTTPGPDR